MNIFSKINQNLLERYPSIWNTKIVWILSIAFCVHLLFFVIGLLSHSNPTSLQNYYVLDDYFNSGLVLANIVISILLLVGWLVYMFKNNSFKNFYPTSSLHLFGQFFQYFIIVLFSTTFYYSYMFGFQTYVNVKYDDAKMIKQIDLVNKVYPFLTFEPSTYLVTNKQYPEAFSELYCETDPNKIDTSKKYYTYYNSFYQFYDLYAITVTERDSLNRFIYPKREELNAIPLAYTNEQEKKCIFYFKKNVADVSEFIKNANMNYGNFSDVLYIFGSGKGTSYGHSNYYDYPEAEKDVDKSIGVKQNKQIVELLKRNNKQEFKKLFSEFLALSDEYQIKHNLTDEVWLKLVFESPNFDVQKFILKNKPIANGNYDYPTYYEDEYGEAAVAVDDVSYGEGNTAEDPLVTERREFIRKATTKNYYEIDNLSSLLANIDEVKDSNFFMESIAIFLWISFAFSTLIFSFRVTNLRALLFGIISAGVVSLVSSIIFVGIAFFLQEKIIFLVSYYGLLISSFIIFIPVFAPNFGSKLFRSILINISVNGFVFYVFLILGIISFHQEEACDKLNRINHNYIPCDTVLETLDIQGTSLVMLISGFIFIFLYSSVIKKWKASPE